MPDVHADVNCPHCGRTNDTHQGLTTQQAPKDGDACLCWGCGKIGVYVVDGNGISQRKPLHAEQVAFDASADVQHGLRLWQQAKMAEQIRRQFGGR